MSSDCSQTDPLGTESLTTRSRLRPQAVLESGGDLSFAPPFATIQEQHRCLWGGFVMSTVAVGSSIDTLAELVERLGGVPLERIRFRPYPGTATEEDVIRIEAAGEPAVRTRGRRAGGETHGIP